MSLKQTIISIKSQLETVKVVNADGSTVKLNVMLWNNQVEREKSGVGYSFSKPAAFIETVIDSGYSIGAGCTGYDVKFRIMVVNEHLNTENELDQNFTIFDVKNYIHRKLNEFIPYFATALQRTSLNLDHDHDNISMSVMEYSSFITDTTGSIYDELTGLYLDRTLTEPIVAFAHGFATSIPRDVTGLDQYQINSQRNFTLATLDFVTGDPYSLNLFFDGVFPTNTIFTVDWGDGSPPVDIASLKTIYQHSFTKGMIYIITISTQDNQSNIQLLVDMRLPDLPYFQQISSKIEQVFSCELMKEVDPHFRFVFTKKVTLIDTHNVVSPMLYILLASENNGDNITRNNSNTCTLISELVSGDNVIITDGVPSLSSTPLQSQSVFELAV